MASGFDLLGNSTGMVAGTSVGVINGVLFTDTKIIFINGTTEITSYDKETYQLVKKITTEPLNGGAYYIAGNSKYFAIISHNSSAQESILIYDENLNKLVQESGNGQYFNQVIFEDNYCYIQKGTHGGSNNRILKYLLPSFTLVASTTGEYGIANSANPFVDKDFLYMLAPNNTKEIRKYLKSNLSLVSSYSNLPDYSKWVFATDNYIYVVSYLLSGVPGTTYRLDKSLKEMTRISDPVLYVSKGCYYTKRTENVINTGTQYALACVDELSGNVLRNVRIISDMKVVGDYTKKNSAPTFFSGQNDANLKGMYIEIKDFGGDFL
ncbi:hypothetical protein CON65_15970 [Bacillus pseudomycoides]|uniref:Uncharacterized protein n=1 Tax=Bacillus pseudomycoides TaxID=64104 RepID=A0AA91ZTJ0_9BACI|nr:MULTISPECIES: hypothetical protein [Bacillus]PEB56253.1 hypothetical protein COO03_01405 [Bacillus sp. AFS098217]PED81683.1 hypothetical protein CON65_15970 [Bacillus pseudomycoides]